MTKLKPCPCGTTPKDLFVGSKDQPVKWKYVSGICCGAWEIEFKAQYKTGDECYALAVEAWNAAPRGKK